MLLSSKWLLLTMMVTSSLHVGDVCPETQMVSSDGQKINLSQIHQRGPVVLIFFPKANTGGCTKELRAFTKETEALGAAGVTLFAISGDSASTLEKFKKELGATFQFVPDEKGRLMNLFQTKMPLVNIASRRTFVVDTLGRIAYIEEGSDAIALKGVRQAIKDLTKK